MIQPSRKLAIRTYGVFKITPYKNLSVTSCNVGKNRRSS